MWLALRAAGACPGPDPGGRSNRQSCRFSRDGPSAASRTPKMAAAPPAYLRRTSRPIPLLPSGPGGVFDLSSSGGEKRRLRDAGGITCRFERAAMDGRTGAQHHGWLLAHRERRRPRQRISGARVDQYRCCLPALAEFSIYRRGGTDGATIDTGGEGGIRTREAGFSRLHTFQACSFDRSDTSPHCSIPPGGGICSHHP